VYRTARWAFRTSGRLTSGARLMPSFVIAGAQRCGTTSLHEDLAQHPSVLTPIRRKGVHYFDVSYDRGLAWYRGHFPTRRTARRTAREEGAEPVITGEASPYYMFHPLAPERIARDLPGVKIIVMLRDPVERAYSAHAHEFARGFETEPFERALDLEESRLSGEAERLRADPYADSHALRHQAYVARGRYVEQLDHLTELFGRERIHVVDSEAFFTDPEPVFAGVCGFLGLPPTDRITFDKHNARPRSPMPDALRERLDAYFAPYDARLAEWLGEPPSWRR
jgi:hypothetical protein